MEKAEKKYNKLAELAILLYFIETTVDGTGRIIDFGFISIQMILFSLAFVASLWPLIKNFKAVMSNPCVIAALVFGIAIIVWAAVGVKNGNRMDYIRTDVTSVLGFALLPGFLASINDNKKLSRMLNAFFAICVCFSALITAVFCFYPFIPESWLQAVNSTIRSSGTVGGFGEHNVYLRGQAVLPAAAAYGVLILRQAKRKTLLYISEALLIFAIILSFERSSWLGLAVAFIVILCFRIKDAGFFIKSGLITLVFIMLLTGIASGTRGQLEVLPQIVSRITNTSVGNNFSYDEYMQSKDNGIAVTQDLDSEERIDEEVFSNPEYPAVRDKVLKEVGADNLRKIILQRHRYYIKKTFPVGAGLGFDLNLNNGGKSEYMYNDFLMKMGPVGFALFMIAYFIPCFLVKKENDFSVFLLAGYLGLAVSSFFEPCLTNPMGLLVLYLLVASVTIDGFNRKQIQ